LWKSDEFVVQHFPRRWSEWVIWSPTFLYKIKQVSIGFLIKNILNIFVCIFQRWSVLCHFIHSIERITDVMVWLKTRNKLIYYTSKWPNINFIRVGLFQNNFWCHVIRGTQYTSLPMGLEFFHFCAYPKIDYFYFW